ncbi:flavorubredoxin [Hydrogenispora ethanolica]|jgi:flavorubredoxin|uniref:Flavorubredoxin n=1 Tax=Hydrogenispora ethanolica TaxID=1082276 RepID=A0A4R1QUH2_HYDET|nr:FprA family A-type flavoprotein [Hydrogenispora ethanolica]TCL56155.1 flavorubredoxin [Hydrogenispora ethanolica]
MHCVQEVTPQIFWVGGNDRRLERFENMFPLPHGVAYNSYLIMDEKTALMDTVDSAISALFLENITHVLNGRQLDYLVINHMEPDHCANIEELVRRYPEVKIVGNKKTFQFIGQFYQAPLQKNFYAVQEGDELSLGRHTLKFFFAPMVHWPEVMLTYEQSERILFSADAFGTFGALSGNLFSDQADFEAVYLEEARRYYANIVGKYGMQVQTALQKLSGVEIRMICPLHGPVWRSNLSYILDKYDHWSKYLPEKNGVVLIYASMYGNTENAMNVLAAKLSQKGLSDLRMYDVSKTHPSYIIADAWKYSHLVFGAPTYNMGLYFVMEALLRDMAGLQLQNRQVALVGNYTWAPGVVVKALRGLVEGMKNMEIIAPPFEINSAMKPEQEPALDQLAEAICASVRQLG